MTAALAQATAAGALDVDDFDAWLAARCMSWQGVERGDYGLSMQHAQMAFLCENPVRWAKAFLREPDTGNPYTFFDYQRPSVLAWDQDVIHQDGAEVGKTREITALVLWGMCTSFGGTIRRPYILVVAPQQTHLDEIIMDIEEHAGITEDAASERGFVSHFWLQPKRTPHTMMRFNTPAPDGKPAVGRVYFRPAGHDGEAFRGVHVNALGLFDEAAKIKNPVIWSEFFRALKPGCKHRIYSVPDGDNSTEFYRMTQQAVPDLDPRKTGRRLFRWAKSLMPPPFWTVERKQHFISLYGGEDSPGYQRNVLGNHGQQENPVFSWAVLEPNFRHLPDYRCLRLLADAGERSLHIVAERVEMRQENGKKIPQMHSIADRYDDLGSIDSRDADERRAGVRGLLAEFIAPAERGVYWFGCDLGYAKDPTEIFVFREIGEELRLVLRVQLKGVGYDLQAEIIHAIDQLFGFCGAWGVDFGSAGTAVVQMLQGMAQFAEGDYDNRMTGFNFAEAMDAISESGELLTQPDKRTGEEKPIRLPAKQLATDLMLRRLQRRGFALPMDSDVVQHLSNHTAREGARHLIYDKTNDHTIDAMRTAMLRKVFNDDSSPDVFGGGVYERSAA
jgi:hypothetical protein